MGRAKLHGLFCSIGSTTSAWRERQACRGSFSRRRKPSCPAAVVLTCHSSEKARRVQQHGHRAHRGRLCRSSTTGSTAAMPLMTMHRFISAPFTTAAVKGLQRPLHAAEARSDISDQRSGDVRRKNAGAPPQQMLFAQVPKVATPSPCSRFQHRVDRARASDAARCRAGWPEPSAPTRRLATANASWGGPGDGLLLLHLDHLLDTRHCCIEIPRIRHQLLPVSLSVASLSWSAVRLTEVLDPFIQVQLELRRQSNPIS